MKLSDFKIKSAKPGPRVVKMSDAGGLFIQVESNGSKLWRLSYRFDKKQKTISLGAYPAVSLAQARVARNVAKALLAQGINPSVARRMSPEAAPPPPVLPTFREVAEEFAGKQKKEGRAERTLAKLDWLFRLAYPALGNRPIAEISPAEVLAVLRLIEDRGQSATANRLRNTFSQVFRYAVATQRASTDPASFLRGALAVVPARHRPGLTDPEAVGGLIRAIRGHQGDPQTRAGLLLCAYTFLRPGEVRNLEWADVNWKTGLLTIPAERMKGKRGQQRSHVVPLSRQVVEVLESIRHVTGRYRLVLASWRAGGRAMSDATLNAALRTMGYSGEVHVAHGFRTTASTILNGQGWNRDWIERQLAHVEGNTVRRAYNAAEYLEGRTQMMQAYADMLDALAVKNE